MVRRVTESDFLEGETSRGHSLTAHLRVEFCEKSRYGRIAKQLAESVAREFDIDVELMPSRGGVFEVSVDGRLVFSKRASYRLPDTDEIAYHVGIARGARETLLNDRVGEGGRVEAVGRLDRSERSRSDHRVRPQG